MTLQGFAALELISPEPCRPFDAARPAFRSARRRVSRCWSDGRASADAPEGDGLALLGIGTASDACATRILISMPSGTSASIPEAAANPLLYHIRTGQARGFATERPIDIADFLPSERPALPLPRRVVVDVVIPVYRGLDETRRCITSVIGQHRQTAGPDHR